MIFHSYMNTCSITQSIDLQLFRGGVAVSGAGGGGAGGGRGEGGGAGAGRAGAGQDGNYVKMDTFT